MLTKTSVIKIYSISQIRVLCFVDFFEFHTRYYLSKNHRETLVTAQRHLKLQIMILNLKNLDSVFYKAVAYERFSERAKFWVIWKATGW